MPSIDISEFNKYRLESVSESVFKTDKHCSSFHISSLWIPVNLQSKFPRIFPPLFNIIKKSVFRVHSSLIRHRHSLSEFPGSNCWSSFVRQRKKFATVCKVRSLAGENHKEEAMSKDVFFFFAIFFLCINRGKISLRLKNFLLYLLLLAANFQISLTPFTSTNVIYTNDPICCI